MDGLGVDSVSGNIPNAWLFVWQVILLAGENILTLTQTGSKDKVKS